MHSLKLGKKLKIFVGIECFCQTSLQPYKKNEHFQNPFWAVYLTLKRKEWTYAFKPVHFNFYSRQEFLKFWHIDIYNVFFRLKVLMQLEICITERIYHCFGPFFIVLYICFFPFSIIWMNNNQNSVRAVVYVARISLPASNALMTSLVKLLMSAARVEM